MSVLAVTTLKGAPGATTVALLLAAACANEPVPARPSSPLLVDADLAGDDLSIRLGLAAAPSLATLALAARRTRGLELLRLHSQRSPRHPGVQAIAGTRGPEQARVVAPLLEPLAGLLRDPALAEFGFSPVICDLGRAATGGATPALLEAADVELLVTRADPPSLIQLDAYLGSRRPPRRRAVVVVGPCPYSTPELERALGEPVAAIVGWDREAVRALERGRLRGSGPLGRAAAQLLRLPEAAPPETASATVSADDHRRPAARSIPPGSAVLGRLALWARRLPASWAAEAPLPAVAGDEEPAP
jgi:hypothetical protein